jgi:hypothetical protein
MPDIWILYLKLQRKKFAVRSLDGDSIWPKYFPTGRYQNAENRNKAGPRLVGTLGKIIIYWPFEPMFFKLLGGGCPRTGLANIFWGHVSKLLTVFWGIIYRMEIWFYCNHISVYSKTSYRPLQFCAPGSCPAGPPLSPALIRKFEPIQMCLWSECKWLDT